MESKTKFTLRTLWEVTLQNDFEILQPSEIWPTHFNKCMDKVLTISVPFSKCNLNGIIRMHELYTDLTIKATVFTICHKSFEVDSFHPAT
jgi:hypothetical protein